MKYKKIIWLLIIFVTLIAFYNCKDGSKKGQWTESDKQKFNSQLESVDLSALGEYKSQMIDCYLNKIEENYTSYEEADKDVEGCKNLGFECYDEFIKFTSKKGRWCESDKQKFNDQMDSVELTDLGEYKSQMIECYLNKVEANYSSFEEANKDVEGCKSLGFKCYNEIINSISKKGKWSELDKQKFYMLMESEDLSNLGKYKAQMLECYFNKVEAKYSSFEEADKDIEGCKKLGLKCVDEFYNK